MQFDGVWLFGRHSLKMVSPETNCYDVAVVGAGPAGCSAARALAQNGMKVVLIEKARLPRYKTCGGGVLGRAYRLLPDAAREVVEREFRSIALSFMGAGMDFVATRPTPLVYMTMRAELDFLLTREARKAGAEVVESCHVRGVFAGEEFVEVTGEGRKFRAKFLVAADGVHSAIAKAAGWPDLPQLAPALEWEVYLAHEEFQRLGSSARFDFNVIEAGYAWVFPKRDHLSVGILSMRRRSPDLHAMLERYLERVGIDKVQRVERHGYLIPVHPRPGRLARGRVLLVGDTAGLVDPITAEGISHAVLSGRLAANAICEGGLDVLQVGRRYEVLVQKAILRELRAARLLAHFLYNCPGLRNWAFRRQGMRLTDFVVDVVMGERSYSGAIASPASYLKMLLNRKQP
jgi:geranylgeranyl reductase family protein